MLLLNKKVLKYFCMVVCRFSFDPNVQMQFIFRFGIKELKQTGLAEVEHLQTNNSGFMYE